MVSRIDTKKGAFSNQQWFGMTDQQIQTELIGTIKPIDLLSSLQ